MNDFVSNKMAKLYKIYEKIYSGNFVEKRSGEILQSFRATLTRKQIQILCNLFFNGGRYCPSSFSSS